MSENSQNTYGGQALIEGVMIRGKKTAVMSVRSPEGEIIRKEIKFSRFYKPEFLKVPVIRGILNLIDSLVVGTKALIILLLLPKEKTAMMIKVILVLTLQSL